MHEQFALLFREGGSAFSRGDIIAIYHRVCDLPRVCNVEAGENVSHEKLDQGFGFGIFFQLPVGTPVDIRSIIGRDDLNAELLVVKFQGTSMDSSMQHRPYNEIAQQAVIVDEERGPIRHFVAWRFREGCVSEQQRAVEGYRGLPAELDYFLHLETGTIATAIAPAAAVVAPITQVDLTHGFSVALYSTLRDAEAQAAFVADARRVRFKETYVKPYLQEPNAVLVFDFVPVLL